MTSFNDAIDDLHEEICKIRGQLNELCYEVEQLHKQIDRLTNAFMRQDETS